MATESLSLTDLRVLAKAVELGSLSAAAEAFGLPKSTATRQLQRLEVAVGQRLLNRGGGRFSATAEGRELVERTRAAIEAIDDAVSDVGGSQGSLTGHLRIAAPHTFGRTVIAPTLAGFMALHPRLMLSLDLSSRAVDLLADEADIAVRVGDPHGEVLVARLLVRDRLRLVAAPSYLASVAPIVAVGDLADKRVLDFRSDTGDGFAAIHADGTRQRVADAFVALRSNEPEVVARAARSGAGIALVPESFVLDDLRAGRLCEVCPGWRWPSRDINALYAPGRGRLPRIRAFLDHLVAQLVTDPA